MFIYILFLGIAVLIGLSGVWELLVIGFAVNPNLKSANLILETSQVDMEAINSQCAKLIRFSHVGIDDYNRIEAEKEYMRLIGVHQGRMEDVGLLLDKVDAVWDRYSLFDKIIKKVEKK